MHQVPCFTGQSVRGPMFCTSIAGDSPDWDDRVGRLNVDRQGGVDSVSALGKA